LNGEEEEEYEFINSAILIYTDKSLERVLKKGALFNQQQTIIS